MAILPGVAAAELRVHCGYSMGPCRDAPWPCVVARWAHGPLAPLAAGFHRLRQIRSWCAISLVFSADIVTDW